MDTNDTFAQRVASQVAAEAEERGWSQSELARKSGVALSTLRRYFFEVDREPTLDATAAVADALGMSVTELVARAEAHGRDAQPKVKHVTARRLPATEHQPHVVD